MSTHIQVASSANNVHSTSAPERSPSKHPVLKAFERIECGQLLLRTPEGDMHNFLSKNVGPVAHLYLHDWKVLDALMARGEIGFAESYMDGMWDTPNLPVLLTFALANANALEKYFYGRPIYALFKRITSLLSSNTKKASRQNVRAHYDLGNNFYQLWLDKSMTYSCALFGTDVDISLEDAQQAKYRRILNKLAAKPGARILDIGCGWGGFAEAAAKEGMKVTGITISEKQKFFAEERLKRAGLDVQTEIKLMDYRDVKDKYDYVVSIGMFEHVGEQYWTAYFNAVKDCLNPGGKAMIQSITIDHEVFLRTHKKYGFLDQYIFPGGALASKYIFADTAEKAGLACKEIFAFGENYVLTLNKWLENFNRREKQVRALGYDESFIRMWRMYLAGCIATFTTGRTDVIQAELING